MNPEVEIRSKGRYTQYVRKQKEDWFIRGPAQWLVIESIRQMPDDDTLFRKSHIVAQFPLNHHLSKKMLWS